MATEKSPHDLRSVGRAFYIPGDFASAEPYGDGHINDTYAATYSQGGAPIRYIHQRINHNVFRDPPRLMENIERVCSHLNGKLLAAGSADRSRRTLTCVPSRDGRSYHRDAEGNHWRTYIFIENATTYNTVQTPAQAYQAANAFGEFQKQLTDLPGERLHETIPDFHNTRARFDALQNAIDADVCNRARDAQAEIAFAAQRADIVDVLVRGQAAGELPERITHNDTKLNNVMLDDATGEGLCVIDLDTVMPGLSLHDFGDMIRSICRPVAEDEPDTTKVVADMAMFEAALTGYLESAGDMLVPAERALLPFSAKLITFEIGLRFLTDYLQGDTYFKTHRPGHNLDRCRVQFALMRSLEANDALAETMLRNAP